MIENVEEWERLKMEISSLEKSIATLTTNKHKAIALLSIWKSNEDNDESIIEKRIKKLKDDIRREREELSTSTGALRILIRRQKYNSCWTFGYGREGIQSYALKNAILELNEHMQAISDKLTDGILNIKLLTEKTLSNKRTKTAFEFQIADTNKKGLPFKEWSKGQRKRIEIITSFALMNLETAVLKEVFLDEMFDGVDEIGISKIVTMLETEAVEKDRKFIVFSHSKHIRELFPNRGHILLKNGKSQLIIGE
jgi:hypothetical protein